MRTYPGMRLAPNMGVPQLREELQRADTYLKQVSQALGRVAFAPPGSGPSGGNTGSVPDLTQFWYLPGRLPEQRAFGRNLVEGIAVSAAGSGTPTVSQKVGFFAHDQNRGIPSVWLGIEGTDHGLVNAGHADRPYKQNRYWVFPAFNQLAAGETVGLHQFVDAFDYQVLSNKTMSAWVLETSDIAGMGIVESTNRGETESGTTKAALLVFHGSYPTTGWKRTANSPSGGSYPSLAIPPLDVNAGVTAPTREKHHVLCVMRKDHTDTSPFEDGGLLMGGGTGRELYPMFTTPQGTLTAPANNSFPIWHPSVTKSCDFVTSSAVVTIASGTTGLYKGQRMRETTASYALSEDTHILSVDSGTQITMSQTWAASNLTRDVNFFGMTWSDSAIAVALEHSALSDRTEFTVNCTTNGTTAVTSAGLFGPVQVGHAIYGTGIPEGTTVTVVTDASNITISQAATDSTTNVRNFASNDHTQLIRKYGPTNQYIGVQPGGTIPAGSLHLSRGLSVGSTIVNSFETVHIERQVTSALTNFALFKMTHSGTGTVSGTHKTLLVQNLGAPSRSAGSPSFTGMDVQITPNVPGGLTDNIILGINMSAVSTLGGGSSAAEITGLNAETGTSGIGTVTLMRAAAYTLRPGTSTVGSIRALELLSSSTTQQTGTVSNMFGIYMDALAAAATISGAGAITNFYGIYRSTGLPAAVTNKWFIYLDADIPSIHRGTMRLGDNTTAAHFLEIAGGTTTKAPIKLTSAAPITAAIAGCLEFQTDDFFATITTGAARKAFILDDGTRLTSGRIPFATTNGRLVDDADLTFITDTLYATKVAVGGTLNSQALTVTGIAQFHNSAATRYRGDLNPTGTDLVIYHYDDTGAVELPVSIGLNRYFKVDGVALTLTISDTMNFVFATGTGTKFATATNQKMGFWNTAPIVQPTTAGGAATFVTNTSLIANDSATFDGYTIGQVVKALRNMGLLA